MPEDPPRLNSVGDFVLTDPRALRALAEPLRLSLFDLVRRNDAATAPALAELVGADEGTVESHLQELAAVGLVEASPAESGELRWTTRGRGIYFEIPEDDEETQQAARQLSRVMLVKYADLPGAWARDDEPELDLEWARAAGLFNARVELTPEELREIQVGLERLLEPFSTRTGDDVPAGAAPVRILAFFMPGAAPAG